MNRRQLAPQAQIQRLTVLLVVNRRRSVHQAVIRPQKAHQAVNLHLIALPVANLRQKAPQNHQALAHLDQSLHHTVHQAQNRLPIVHQAPNLHHIVHHLHCLQAPVHHLNLKIMIGFLSEKSTWLRCLELTMISYNKKKILVL